MSYPTRHPPPQLGCRCARALGRCASSCDHRRSSPMPWFSRLPPSESVPSSGSWITACAAARWELLTHGQPDVRLAPRLHWIGTTVSAGESDIARVVLKGPGVSDAAHYAKRVRWLAVVHAALFALSVTGFALLIW